MNKLLIKYFPVLTIAALLLGSCNQQEKSDTKEIVTVSILPQKYIVDKISGGKLKVNVLVPPGASPAAYEATPRQMADFDNSVIYFRIGHIIFEKTWIDKIMERSPGLKVSDLSEGIELLEDDMEGDIHEEDSHQHGHKHGRYDPHIWMSPKNMISISEKLLLDLKYLFPEMSQEFDENFHLLRNEIMEIDSLYTRNLKLLKGLNFLIYHPALAYLAKDYGMIQHVLEAEGKEPGPAHIAEIIGEAKKNQVKYIFVQKQFNRENALVLAKEINAEVIDIDPLAEDWYAQMKLILEILIKK